MLAEFYLQTIDAVFQQFFWVRVKSKLVSEIRLIDLRNITKCCFIWYWRTIRWYCSSVGQTKAALTLCSNIPESMKRYNLQKGAGITWYIE